MNTILKIGGGSQYVVQAAHRLLRTIESLVENSDGTYTIDIIHTQLGADGPGSINEYAQTHIESRANVFAYIRTMAYSNRYFMPVEIEQEAFRLQQTRKRKPVSTTELRQLVSSYVQLVDRLEDRLQNHRDKLRMMTTTINEYIATVSTALVELEQYPTDSDIAAELDHLMDMSIYGKAASL